MSISAAASADVHTSTDHHNIFLRTAIGHGCLTRASEHRHGRSLLYGYEQQSSEKILCHHLQHTWWRLWLLQQQNCTTPTQGWRKILLLNRWQSLSRNLVTTSNAIIPQQKCCQSYCWSHKHKREKMITLVLKAQNRESMIRENKIILDCNRDCLPTC